MIFREASINDAKRCDELLTQLIEDEYINYDDSLSPLVVDDFYKNILVRENTKIILCEEKGKIVGYIYAYLTEEKHILIDALFVLPEYRNRKIATKLIDGIKLWAKEDDVSIIEISVLSKNERAKHLYNKLGFITFKETLRLNEGNNN